MNLLLDPDSIINLIVSKLFAYNRKILSHFIISIHLQFISGSNIHGKPHDTCSLVSNPLASKLFNAVTAGEQELVILILKGESRDMEKMQFSRTSRVQDW